MGEAKSTSGTKLNPSAPEAASRPSEPFSPVRVFVGLVILLIVAGTIIYVTKPEASVQNAEAGLPESNNFALTDAEAITRFKELDALRLDAMSLRDETLVPVATTSDSPLRGLAYSDIAKLKDHDVTVDPNFETRQLTVQLNTQEMIVIEQEVLEAPRFFDNRKRLVEPSSQPQLRTIRWELRPETDQWKLFSSKVIESSPISGGKS